MMSSDLHTRKNTCSAYWLWRRLQWRWQWTHSLLPEKKKTHCLTFNREKIINFQSHTTYILNKTIQHTSFALINHRALIQDKRQRTAMTCRTSVHSLHFQNRVSWYTYVRWTNKTHILFINEYKLIKSLMEKVSILLVLITYQYIHCAFSVGTASVS